MQHRVVSNYHHHHHHRYQIEYYKRTNELISNKRTIFLHRENQR